MSTNSSVPYNENLYLLLPDNSFVPIELSVVSFGRRGHIVLRTANGQTFQIISLTENLRQELEQALLKMSRRSVANLLDITPEQVVMYFEASPVLREMADDVRQVLLSGKTSEIEREQAIQVDLERVAHLGPKTSLADLAEVIFGRRNYGGREHSYLQKLQKKLTSSTSSYGSEDVNPLKSLKRAA
jgi:hypothetical protein